MATILVVDDEKDIRELVGYGLKRFGHKVLEAENGDAALDLLDQHKVQILVTDIRMPVRDGVSLLKEIRKRKLGLSSIIVMTGFSDVSPEEIMSLGAKHIL